MAALSVETNVMRRSSPAQRPEALSLADLKRAYLCAAAGKIVGAGP
jgi:hypothetical protein